VPSRARREEVLTGGTANRGSVVRIGDTVRRPMRTTSPAAHALLTHLERAGFPGAPRFLGIDEEGREVLSYIDGVAPTPPYPRWALTDRVLVEVARLLRDFHDVVAAFDPGCHRWPLPAAESFGEPLISHNDPNLDNVIFQDGRPVALIDFDLAAPGSRAWDVAHAARLWAPLRREQDIDDERRGHALRRFRLFVDAYGMAPQDRALMIEAICAGHETIYGWIADRAVAGHPAFAEYWEGEGGARARRTREWYARSRSELQAAIR
jgi:hypothetical protein